MLSVPTCGYSRNIVIMFISLVIVAQIIHLTNADVICLQCNDVSKPTDCTTFKKCHSSERCFIEAFISSSGGVTYDLGCRETVQCNGLEPIRRRHIAPGANNRYSVDMYGNPVNRNGRTANDPVICSNCCETQLCNSIGCYSNGFENNRGPICSDCVNQDSVESCRKLKVCRQNEVCMLLKTIDTTTHKPKYQTKCEQEQVCNREFIEYNNIYAMFMGQKLGTSGNGGKCSIRCCTADLCNTQCDVPPRLSNNPTNAPTVQSLQKEKDVAAGTPNVPPVHAAEFVAQPELHNTHYPKGHDWNFGNPDVTGMLQTNPNPTVLNNVDHQRILNANSASQEILAALGISELPGQTNASSNANMQPIIEGPNSWVPVNQQPSVQSVIGGWTEMNAADLSSRPSNTSHQLYEAHGMTDLHQRHSPNKNMNTANINIPSPNRDSQSTMIGSAQTVDQALNERVQEVYGARAAMSTVPQSMENNRMFEAQTNAQTYNSLQGQHNNRPDNTGYMPDRQRNVEEQMLTQHDPHNTQSSNSTISNPDAGYALDAPHGAVGHHQDINKPSGAKEKPQSQLNTYNTRTANATPDKSYSSIPPAEKHNHGTHQQQAFAQQQPSNQHHANEVSRNTAPNGPETIYNAQQTNLNVDSNGGSNKPVPNHSEDPRYVDTNGPASNEVLTPQLLGQFEFLTDAQRQHVLQVLNSQIQSDARDINANQLTDASGNLNGYQQVQQNQNPYPSNVAQTGLNVNRMQDIPNSHKPNTVQDAAMMPPDSNLPPQYLDLHQTNTDWNTNPPVSNVHPGGSNRLSTDIINEMTHNRAAPVTRDLLDKTGILNAKENTFSARNRDAPWTQNKKESTTVDRQYQSNLNNGPVRQNVIGEIPNFAEKNGRSAQPLANMRPQQNSWNNPNIHQVPVTPPSSQSATIQQMSDPRNSARLSGEVSAGREMPYPELLNPARGQAPQGIKHVQRITRVDTSIDYNPTYQKYHKGTIDKSPHPMETRRYAEGKHTFEIPQNAGNIPTGRNGHANQRYTFNKPDETDASRYGTGMNSNFNRARNVEPATVQPAAPVSAYPDSLTPPPSVDILSMKVAYPCLRNPCVRGTCREAYGTYKCKCESGFSGKNCEQALPVTSPSNFSMTTPAIDSCFSNPCMRGKCSSYKNTYRCICDHGFYGRDCEKVSLGGAAFLGALGLNIDACQAQGQPCVNGNCTSANNKAACTCEPGYTGTTCDEVLDHCSSLPCVRGTCINSTSGFECACPSGFNGIHCEAIDYCATSPCRHGTCSNTAVSYVCNCSPGYTGSQCELVDHCSSSPCVRGRCSNRQTEFHCSCPAGYIGKQCEAIDFCFPSPCVHGMCVNSNTGYTCKCPKGFYGKHCQKIDHCASRPCINGDCENLDKSYVCTCAVGYIGKQCQTVDHCASKPCAHGRCINSGADFRCQCPYAYTGKQCQTVNHCSSSPCSRGECKNSNTGYKCICPPGYTGPQCATVDHCHEMPCARGTCLNSNTGYTCILTSGYIGSHLQGRGQAMDYCASSPCAKGTCVNSNTRFVCQCPSGYYGAHCDIFIPSKPSGSLPRMAEYHYTSPPNIAALRKPKVPDHCASSPCKHGACVSSKSGFKCKCKPGFKGSLCEKPDHCASSPCKRGSCAGNDVGFKCTCPLGFKGKTCEIADPCASKPCVHGSCVSTNTGYKCNCNPGYRGLNCKARDHCASSPCQQGICVSSSLSFKCTCPIGFSGVHCEIVDHCASKPCTHGKCVSSPTGYQCKCQPSYIGVHCELKDFCSSYPCLRGVCTNSALGYRCTCPARYTGVQCEMDAFPVTDYCTSIPCVRGTCVSRDIDFLCICPAGFSGVYCEIDMYAVQNPCASLPCNKGICVNTEQGYNCVCPSGYTGVHCEVVVEDMCASNMCKHGRCIPSATIYTCECFAGYSGLNCEIKDGNYCQRNPGTFALCGHGNCSNVGSGYECQCDRKYNGTHCLFQYDCFGGHVCFHDGLCVNKKFCACRSGYTGKHCGSISSYERLKLKQGDIVTRGRDWSYDRQDGGMHSVGKVISLEGAYVNVMWVNGEQYHYRMAFGKYDLQLAP